MKMGSGIGRFGSIIPVMRRMSRHGIEPNTVHLGPVKVVAHASACCGELQLAIFGMSVRPWAEAHSGTLKQRHAEARATQGL
jgi:hypothetical protein